MRKTALLHIFILFVGFSIAAQDQDDLLQYKASYDFLYKTQPEQETYEKEDIMFLEIYPQATMFHSYYAMVRDSVKQVAIKQGLSAYEIVDAMRPYKKGVTDAIYTFFDQQTRVTSQQLTKKYFYEEELTMPQWQIDGQNQREVEGYTCMEAKASYLGREWTVYFTPEIPFNYGPWKLWGLPGLIVEATDADEFFVFRLTGFEKASDEKRINYPYKDEKFAKIGKRELSNLEKLFYKDFIEFQRLTMPGLSVQMSKEQNERYQQLKMRGGIPFIPLEPW